MKKMVKMGDILINDKIAFTKVRKAYIREKDTEKRGRIIRVQFEDEPIRYRWLTQLEFDQEFETPKLPGEDNG